MTDALLAVNNANNTPRKNPDIWAAAQAVEASFLSEMLKSSGVGAPRSAFGGGEGEAQFSSFLTDEYARSMAAAGGVGLAESIYRSLTKGGPGL